MAFSSTNRSTKKFNLSQSKTTTINIQKQKRQHQPLSGTIIRKLEKLKAEREHFLQQSSGEKQY